jgi:hypothetical protein
MCVYFEKKRKEKDRTRLTAYKHLDLVATLGRRDIRADKLAADVPLCTSPARWWVVERVDDAKRVWVHTLERGQLIAEEYVRVGHVGVEQREARLVRGVA